VRTELVHFGSRDYDPRIGRWTTKDPIGFEGGALSLYAYAGHSPTNFIDPNGKAIFIPILVGAVVSAGIDIAIQLATKDECQGIDWGQVGMSAAFGALGGGLAAAGSRALTGHLVARNVAMREAGAFLPGSYYASKLAPAARAAHAGVGVGAGAATGAGHQAARNASEGRPLSSGVAQSALGSGVMGGLGSSAGGAASRAARSAGASPTAEAVAGAASRSSVVNSGMVGDFMDQ
jgi:hypothetical protein